MNSKQAKELPLPDFLAQLGYQPANVRGPDIWYRSPFRPDERTPSFKIDRNKNVWFDFGLGQGGTIIDNDALAALTLFIAVNKPEEMETVKKVVISMLNRKDSA